MLILTMEKSVNYTASTLILSQVSGFCWCRIKKVPPDVDTGFEAPPEGFGNPPHILVRAFPNLFGYIPTHYPYSLP